MTDIAEKEVKPTGDLVEGLRLAFASPRARPVRTQVRRPAPPTARVRSAATKPSASPPAHALRSAPVAARLDMPVQDLASAPEATAVAGAASMSVRRAVLIAAPALIAAGDCAVMSQVLGRHGLTPIEALTVALSVILSGWVGFGFVSATMGFVAALTARAAPATAPRKPTAGRRTAILMPTYNEDPGLILAAVQAIAEDLRRLEIADLYDLYILSDTRDDAVAEAEAAGLIRLRTRMEARAPQLYYRRRPLNIDRKAGNVADWVETHGGDYAYMLVLDADSLMAAETIAEITAAMDADPRLGLLQTVPTIVNAETPFARLQQFASRLYGPVFALGQQSWSGTEGNYWGHNAIIRVAAFASSAGLPRLSGPKPFGGHILSHDFVEAALLRRRGWAVRTVAGLGGSYEETPPTLLDTAARDRRWCQGNLQHARLLAAAGLHWISRLHLFCGIFAYLAPGLWLALLICGGVVWPQQHLTPGAPLARAVFGLFAMSLALLAAPKAMAVWLALTDAAARRGFGGAAPLLAGFVVESLVSLLTTPVMMIMQSVAVFEVLIGRDSGWVAQRREGAELSRRDAWRAHGVHVALGVFGGLGAFVVSRDFLVWASPVFLSLALSALLSLHTSRPRAGRALRRRGLFHTPEEAAPPPVLARALTLRAAYAAEAGLRGQIVQLMRKPSVAYEIGGRAAPAGEGW
jgi:membrane glycosyltransferase